MYGFPRGTARHRERGGTALVIDPTAYGSCVLWLRSSDRDSIGTVQGGSIDTWQDRAQGRVFSTNDVRISPLYISDVYQGIPGVLMQRGSYMATAQTPIAGTTPRTTITVVGQHGRDGGGQAHVWGYGGKSDSGSHNLGKSLGQYYVWHRGGPEPRLGACALGTPDVIATRYDGTEDHCYFNGTKVASITIAMNTDAGAMCLNARYDRTFGGEQMVLYEVMLFTADLGENDVHHVSSMLRSAYRVGA